MVDCSSHHSLVGHDLLGVPVEESHDGGEAVRRQLLPGAIGEDGDTRAARENLLRLTTHSTQP